MGVSPDHQAGAAVAKVPHSHLFRGRLGVHVDDDGVGGLAQRTGVQGGIDGGERIVQSVHVHPAQEIDDQNPQSALGLEQLRASPRRGGHGRIVQGANETGFSHNIGQGLFLIPRMIAKREAIGAGVEQLARGGLGDAIAGGGVLGVDDDELQTERAAKPRQVLGQALPTGPSDNVAKEGYAHR